MFVTKPLSLLAYCGFWCLILPLATLPSLAAIQESYTASKLPEYSCVQDVHQYCLGQVDNADCRRKRRLYREKGLKIQSASSVFRSFIILLMYGCLSVVCNVGLLVLIGTELIKASTNFEQFNSVWLIFLVKISALTFVMVTIIILQFLVFKKPQKVNETCESNVLNPEQCSVPIICLNMKVVNNSSDFLNMFLIMSGDVELNPGPPKSRPNGPPKSKSASSESLKEDDISFSDESVSHKTNNMDKKFPQSVEANEPNEQHDDLGRRADLVKPVEEMEEDTQQLIDFKPNKSQIKTKSADTSKVPTSETMPPNTSKNTKMVTGIEGIEKTLESQREQQRESRRQKKDSKREMLNTTNKTLEELMKSLPKERQWAEHLLDRDEMKNILFLVNKLVANKQSPCLCVRCGKEKTKVESHIIPEGILEEMKRYYCNNYKHFLHDITGGVSNADEYVYNLLCLPCERNIDLIPNSSQGSNQQDSTMLPNSEQVLINKVKYLMRKDADKWENPDYRTARMLAEIMLRGVFVIHYEHLEILLNHYREKVVNLWKFAGVLTKSTELCFFLLSKEPIADGCPIELVIWAPQQTVFCETKMGNFLYTHFSRFHIVLPLDDKSFDYFKKHNPCNLLAKNIPIKPAHTYAPSISPSPINKLFPEVLVEVCAKRCHQYYQIVLDSNNISKDPIDFAFTENLSERSHRFIIESNILIKSSAQQQEKPVKKLEVETTLPFSLKGTNRGTTIEMSIPTEELNECKPHLSKWFPMTKEQETIARLKKEVTRLKEENELLNYSSKESSKIGLSTKKKLESAEARIQNLEEKLSETEQSLHKQQSISEEYQEKYQQLNEEYKEVSEEYQQVNEKYQKLRDNYKQVSEEHQQLSKEYQQLSEEHQQLSEEHRKLSEKHQQLSEKYQQLEKKTIASL